MWAALDENSDFLGMYSKRRNLLLEYYTCDTKMVVWYILLGSILNIGTWNYCSHWFVSSNQQVKHIIYITICSTIVYTTIVHSSRIYSTIYSTIHSTSIARNVFVPAERHVIYYYTKIPIIRYQKAVEFPYQRRTKTHGSLKIMYRITLL